MKICKGLITLLLCNIAFAQDWSEKKVGDFWQLNWSSEYNLQNDSWLSKPVFTCLPKTVSQPPESFEISKAVHLDSGKSYSLEFTISDDFKGDAAGYNFLEISVNGQTVLTYDVSGIQGRSGSVILDPKPNTVITIRAINKKLVSNFGVSIAIEKLDLKCGSAYKSLFTAQNMPELEELPADLPLAAIPVQGLDWTSKAVVVQPWGKSQYDILFDPGDKPRRLAEKFGFNTIIVQPPAAYNRGKYKLSEEQFKSALNAYRKAGYKILIYSSIMHCGHGPEWQSGRLTAQHPDWVQVDSKGGRRHEYGSYWMCPSTGALRFTLNYTRDIVSQYDPDGIMLDNNEFINASEPGYGPTCYCKSCQAKFRAYVKDRFGSKVKETFGLEAADINIPVKPGPLYNLWLHCRNRIWAEATETFRKELSPKIVLANTQYLYKSNVLATDLQYGCEDVVFSESRMLTSIQMSQKMVLGHALAVNKPVWNYLGTFSEDNVQILRSPGELSKILAASMAHCTEPLLVYYGFDGYDKQNEPSRKLLSEMFGFCSQNPALFNALQRWAATAVIFDIRTRNCFGGGLFTNSFESAITQHLPVVGIADLNLLSTDLSKYKTLISQRSSCLSGKEIEKILAWVNAGGILICSKDFGVYDEIARPRRSSPLSKMYAHSKSNSFSCGSGKIHVIDPEADCTGLFDAQDRFLVDPCSASIEAVPYTNQNGFVIHIVNHGDPVSAGWKLVLPSAMKTAYKTALYDSPECYTTEQLILEDGAIKLPAISAYGVVTLRKE